MRDGDRHTITTQATSKKWKAIQLAGALIVLFGTLVAIGLAFAVGGNFIYAPFIVGGSIVGAGVIVLAYGGTMSWWHHG